MRATTPPPTGVARRWSLSGRGTSDPRQRRTNCGHAVAPDGADCPSGDFGGLGDVLSIGKLASGQADYYLEQARARVNAVTSGVEDYYFDGPGPDGDWIGVAARCSLWTDDLLENAKSPDTRGFAAMRRRGLEPPPGYPGPGPQPGAAGVLCVHCVPDRPLRPRFWTIWTHRTIWMLPRMLPRPAGQSRRRARGWRCWGRAASAMRLEPRPRG
jgi:hypothetical protein